MLFLGITPGLFPIILSAPSQAPFLALSLLPWSLSVETALSSIVGSLPFPLYFVSLRDIMHGSKYHLYGSDFQHCIFRTYSLKLQTYILLPINTPWRYLMNISMAIFWFSHVCISLSFTIIIIIVTIAIIIVAILIEDFLYSKSYFKQFTIIALLNSHNNPTR